MNTDLDRMLRHPGSVKRRELVAALVERGWVVARESKHQIWAHGSATVQVPHTLKGTGTIRAIVKRIIEVEEVRHDHRGETRR